MTACARQQGDIARRIEIGDPDDPLGFGKLALIEFLDYDHAKPFLTPAATRGEWSRQTDLDSIVDDYLRFAIGKADGHRGLSAHRSVVKLAAYAWLAGRDDVVAAMNAAGHENYGAPKLLAFAEGMGLHDLWAEHVTGGVARMATGDSCCVGCDEGCGS